MSVWKKFTHLLPWVRRAEERDIREELDALREIAGPGELGNIALAAEDARGVFQFRWLEEAIQDLRYAWRSMRHDKVFALLAVASLALGIGASTAIYSFVDSVLVRPLPVVKPEQLAVLKWHAQRNRLAQMIAIDSSTSHDATGQISAHFPYTFARVVGEASETVASVFSFSSADSLNVSVGSETDEANGQYISGNYFDSLGLTPIDGRLIQATDDVFGSVGVVVVSKSFGDRRFGSATRAVGQAIRVNDKPFVVVGVVPSGFFGVEAGSVPDLYMPMRALAIIQPGAEKSSFVDDHYYWMKIMARLRPGVTLDQARAALAPRFHQFALDSATTDAQKAGLPELRIENGAAGLDTLKRKYAEPIRILTAVVVVILIIACSNLANLLLARGSARRREIAIRLSIGASRVRVIRQLLTESILLSSIGGACGVALAWWSIPAVTALLSNGQSNFSLHADLNWHVLIAALILSIVTGVLFGLAPALQTTRVDITSNLKSSPNSLQASGRQKISLSQGLVVSQIALSLLMLVGAGLLGDTLANLHGINVGFNRDNVLLFTIRSGPLGYAGEARTELFENLRTRLSQLPGVQHVSLSNSPVPMGGGTTAAMTVLGAPVIVDTDGRPPYAVLASVGPAFFSTMQIPLISGRELTEQDRKGAPKSLVVNRRFGRAFGVENPLGRVVEFGKSQYTIVGVVDDALNFSLKGEIRPIAYFSYLQSDAPPSGMTFEVRTVGRPLSLTGAVSSVVRAVDWRLAVIDPKTQSAHIDRGISQEITLAVLCSTFAIVALVIACVGLYGTVAFSVARRTNEIGIRMALGASGRRIVWMVLRDVVVMAVAGFGVGLPLVFVGTRYVASFLYGIKPHDPVAISTAIALLLSSALLAGLAPALRASRIAPMGAVRRD